MAGNRFIRDTEELKLKYFRGKTPIKILFSPGKGPIFLSVLSR